jgi:hypothetical protein
MREKTIVTSMGDEFQVREATMRTMLQHMKLMSEDTAAFQLELAKASIYKDGQPLGDAVLDLGLKNYSELAVEVMEVNGFFVKG